MTKDLNTTDNGAQVAEWAITLDSLRPRRLCQCAAEVAVSLLKAGRCPSEDRRAALAELEKGLERVRRTHPEAWRAERHVDALGRLMALDARANSRAEAQAKVQAETQAKASGSDALRSAT
ncbi:MAG: hypothetical protein AAF577_06990 [Pseudomonadota bacterium]